MDGDHYVYLLLDPRDRTYDELRGGLAVFYVGQGSSGGRPGNHEDEAVDWDLRGRPTGTGVNEAKCNRILDMRSEHCHVVVHHLRVGLTKAEANLVETAAIDLLGPDNLTNGDTGPLGSSRIPVKAYEMMSAARSVALGELAVVVPSQGRWGGGRDLSGMLEAGEEAIWENARQCWGVAEYRRARFRELAKTSEPVILIAVQSGRAMPKAAGIVLGVWEIADVVPGCVRDVAEDGTPKRGVEFTSLPPTDRVRRLRGLYVGHRLIDSAGSEITPQSGVRYFPSWETGDGWRDDGRSG